MKVPPMVILKRIAQESGHVLLSQAEYKRLKEHAVLEYVPTDAERKAITNGQLAYREGKTLSLEELERELAR